MISHRLRLSLVSTATSGVVLALLFVAIVFSVRAATFAERRNEITTALNALTLDPNEAFDIREFREAHPDLSCTVFDPKMTEVRGPLRLIRVDGFRKLGHQLLYGKSFRGQTIVVGTDWGETEHGLKLLALVLLGLWVPLALLVGLATYFAAGSVFRPLQRLTAQASAVAGIDLGERLRTEDRAEFGEFAEALNGMLARIELEARRSERFASDAAHELRTPLAILRARIDTALLNPRSEAEYVGTLERARKEMVRLTDIVEALLRTARGEVAEADPIDLRVALTEATANWRERFSERSVKLEVSTDEAKVAITSEEIRIVLDNLLDNALRFAPPDSEVMVNLTSSHDEVEIVVRDHGPGIPVELGDRVFDRLVRADDSRNRAPGGFGIGLSMVRRIAEARGGQATQTTAVGGGAAIVVRLPKA